MVIFRADVSPRTGLRHLRRSAYLAALLKKNNHILFCSREEKKAAKFLAEHKITASLGKDPNSIDLTAVKTIIFDLPHFSGQDGALFAKAKKMGVKTVQIISAGDEHQPVDFLLSSLSTPPFQDMAGAILLAGVEYTLLHHKFRHFNQVKRKYRKSIRNIFINLGDLLPYRSLREAIDVLHRLHLKMKIAPGLNLKKADKRNLMKIYPGIHFCGKSESPARAYFEADLALVPAGEEILETACVGTPALYFCQDSSHEAVASIWADQTAGIRFGRLEDLTLESFREIIAPLTLERREQMGASGKKLVDGLGVQRFFKVLKENGIIT